MRVQRILFMLAKMIKERENYMDDLKCETKEKCSGLDNKLDQPKPKKRIIK